MDNFDSITSTSPWIKMRLDNWTHLIEGRAPKLFARGSFFYHQDDCSDMVYIVVSGCIRVTTYQNDGQEIRFYIIERGGILGETACLMQLPHLESALAIIDTKAYCVPAEVFRCAVSENQMINEMTLKSICTKTRVLTQQVISLSFCSPTQRAARMLLYIYKEYGQSRGNIIHIDWRLTNQNLACMINVSRVTVNKIIGRFIEEGVLKKEGNYYQLLNHERLKQYALHPAMD